MRLILSRKGVDSGNARIPSPVLPDGSLCLLYIPERPAHAAKAVRYASVRSSAVEMGKLVADLSGGRLTGDALAHLDPDLDPQARPRDVGWRPLFGQAGTAEKHLQGAGVGAGDLFLFFGWFREVELHGGRYRWMRGAPDRHVLFGWLQIARRLAADRRAALPAWARDHPHACGPPYPAPSSLYVASRRLAVPGAPTNLPGGGRFPRYVPQLALTAPGRPRSVWQLPSWFHRVGAQRGLTYHRKIARWERTAEGVHLRSASRGQEFVLDCQDYPEATAWIAALLGHAG